jgi:cobalt-zinc-cadmium efflux system membrane fusion protein
MPEFPVTNACRSRARALCLMLTVAAGGIAATACAPKADARSNESTVAAKPGTFKVTDAQRAKLQIVTLASVKFHPTLEATGTVAFNGDRSTSVLSPISGPVARIVTTLGASVVAGQTLATVSSPDFATAVATYRKAEEMVRNTNRILTLDEKLFANDALAHSELDQARTDASAALADRDAAVASMRSLGVDNATINAIRDGKQASPVEGAVRAPIPGIVVEKLINPGQLLQAGMTAAFTVADLSTMWIFASVYGADVSAVSAGQSAEIIADGSAKPVSARVDYVAPIVDPGTKATSVRLIAGNGSQLLKRDMFVRIRIFSTKERNGLLVPAAAVLRDEDNLPFVFLANADGSFSRRRVTLGARVGEKYEITAGLTAGDKVLADGALFVQFAENQ